MHICQYKRRFSRCKNEATGLCQFCGRVYCPEHGTFDEDGSEVCAREVCRLKHQDLPNHMVWRDAALDRSNRGFCGMPDCESGRWGQCSKCQALFCERHLQTRSERVRDGSITFSRPASMCDHCAARNKLWSRI